MLIFLLPILFIVSTIILFDDGFPIFFKQKRIGKNSKAFQIFKFRTMKKDTKDIATHLVKNFENNILYSGHFFRKYSVDELPQLINILKGDMKFIGPRPALYNQFDLIELRKSFKVDLIKPGITGWAQVNGRDEVSIKDKVKLDAYYIKNRNLFLDFKIVLLTLYKVINKSGVKG